MHIFYEYKNPHTLMNMGWHQYPDGTLDYIGEVELGYSEVLAKAYKSCCRPARSVIGVIPDQWTRKDAYLDTASDNSLQHSAGSDV